MTDTVIKGTGNSRTIKAAPATLPATYDEFRAKFISSGIPIDLLGLNDAGLTTRGNDLNKSTLLTDALCSALGLPTTATPTQAMEKLRQLVNTAQQGVNNGVKMEIVSYVGTDKYGADNPSRITFSFAPKVVFFLFEKHITSNLKIELSGSGIYSILMTDFATTDFQQYIGFCDSHGVDLYGRKKDNGKTFEWYLRLPSNNSYFYSQLNSKDYRYYFCGLG